MTVRSDIGNGRLIYTCNCGWIDLGHADSKTRRPNVGAQSLWDQIKNPKKTERFVIKAGGKAVPMERYAAATGVSTVPREITGYRVTYKQDMRVKITKVWLSASEEKTYVVQAGLSEADQKSVALAIFMEVSLGFEEMQGSWPYSMTRAKESSFSEEDLVSNLIGFYKVVEPSQDYLKLCQPVSIQASEAVWDKSGAVGMNKNRSFKPVFHPCKECTRPPLFPTQLQTIKAASKGDKFYDLGDQPLTPARWR